MINPDKIEQIAIDISGCREHFGPYNPHSTSPRDAFHRLWPCDQEMWKRRAEACLRHILQEKDT